MNNKGSSEDASNVIMEIREHIQILESEVYFLQEELKEKSFLLKSLIIAKQNANNCSHYQQHLKNLRHRVQQ